MIGRSKFNVGQDKTDRSYDNIVFDSAVEMKFYKEFILPMVKTGEITHFERQKTYELQPSFLHHGKPIHAIKYRADFYIEYSNGKSTVIDIKGYPDNVAKIKKKMFHYKYPSIDYQWIGYSKSLGGWKTYEAIQEGRKIKNRERKKRKMEKKEKNSEKDK